MADTRTPEVVTSEIRHEREQLALAVSHLRSELKAATDVKAVLRAKLPQIAVGTAVACGAWAAKRMLNRRRERKNVVARFGRFVVIARD